MKETVLIAGFTTRHVAASAYRAGYRVVAADHFCDSDLARYVEDLEAFGKLTDLPRAIAAICSRNQVDHCILTSGAEGIRMEGIASAGIDPERIMTFINKASMQQFFAEHGFLHPLLAGGDEYPVLIKPVTGAGGWRNAIIRSAGEKEAWIRRFGSQYVCQQIIDGVSASVSCISNGKKAVAIASNEQILRNDWRVAFGLAGTVTPCDHPLTGEMMDIAEEIVSASGCLGSVEVDFILSDEVVALEINPRFQASLEPVEMATGVNLFSLHMDACVGEIPPRRPEPLRYAVRRFVFADEDCLVRYDLSSLGSFVADIPSVGSVCAEGATIASVIGVGQSRKEALAMADRHAAMVQSYLRGLV